MILAIVVCASRISIASANGLGHLCITDLHCEYLRDPLAVEEGAPRLGWIVESDRRGDFATAYQILVASSLDRLSGDEGDLWDTGEVKSNSTVQIPYAGRPLTSRQRCFWKVRAWGRDGVSGEWSEPARWEMGLLSPDDWSAKWIEAGANPVGIEVESATYYSVDGAVRMDVTQRVGTMIEGGHRISIDRP